ncbi:hypothetical protein A3I27_02810 [Candidatus Giovannonibacteria bacterium RIFCSPLOWO2_02_FULL_43_11b]|uniref:Uncharacterized protein n=1 Tax=Candidatus Giovannonibacteria bacterium RIFCSPHIGHO2_12_FULL_43_15 TaxID=1798341 RepID=A0A1F5WQX9_9BACT|nr:MAG: hypothetical protein A2739_00045 [Candidatus Giovannonibacteria bacterium RIFCSPHIGHO2_01_FULL_43_100]OGF66108.1 MAG: hypothetical protein A3B97_01225 [Candidatus Giovannonibacteria bacterium RIFCSPHIGHO2_02_FULL_43_32]OGF78072.1 MAG: hypothetical protein A3F23_02620 [Candidatus Giovannonibacteria bacterium RIFCSPHIGHO2_12_FULL_43_15]OGF78815.1 MAG: hypothetical protein A3A15_00310 [Candidatus Giovannonibacteria bacterium RIFCSPLOWO2_01_FULL_43_60]OGF89140.1 MAG: hypothetical protein A3
MYEIAHDLTSNFPSGVSNQLKACGIAGIYLEDLRESLRGILKHRWGPLNSNGKHMYIISLNMNDTISDWAHTVGHELCHTFQEDYAFSDELLSSFCHKYGIVVETRARLRDYINGDGGCTKESFHFYFDTRIKADEVFCEIFSSIWLARPGVRSELEEILHALSGENSIIAL